MNKMDIAHDNAVKTSNLPGGGNRNAAIEFFRCLLMFGIVVQHVVGQSAYIRHGADFLTNWCVCGFVFVSGYFGIKFKPSKFLSLIALGVFVQLYLTWSMGRVFSSHCGRYVITGIFGPIFSLCC